MSLIWSPRFGRQHSFWLSSLALVLLASNAYGQVLGLLTEEEEIELGRLTAEELEQDMVLVTDPLVTSYISDIGSHLAGTSERPDLEYTFKVVDTSEINAFALPGGFIYVNRGLIEAAGTEAELAGVLGHEIGHVVGRHGVEQVQRSSITSIGLRVLDSVLGGGGGQSEISSMAVELATAGTFMKFSRDAEREADRFGVENVARSGYDPKGMISFFETLDALGAGEANAVESFFASHPSPDERMSNVEDLLGSLTVAQTVRDAAEPAGGRLIEIQNYLASMPPPSEAETVLAEAAESADTGSDGEVAPEVQVESLGERPEELLAGGTYPGLEDDYEIAARFAPVLRQAIGERRRFDRITTFDFDGDWVGDNNWDNALTHDLPPAVYFNVSETETHYFVHYAAFHPRDYKGGGTQGVILSEIIREGIGRFGDYDPTGMAQEAVLAHENDMEGALVAVEKSPDGLTGGQVVYVETLAHNEFFKYRVPRGFSGLFGGGEDSVSLEGDHPVLYIEPKGHGIEAYHGGEQDRGTRFLIYRHESVTDAPPASGPDENDEYTLVSIPEGLWPRALGGENETYGATFDYGEWTVEVASAETGGAETLNISLGELGAMFRGVVGGVNMARPPWGWFDRNEEDRRQGEWFLTPAETIKRHFDLDDSFSTVYRHHPVMGVYRDLDQTAIQP